MNWIKRLFKRNKSQNIDYSKVKTYDDLLTLHTKTEMKVGMDVYVEDRGHTYILNSIDFDKENINENWLLLRDVKLNRKRSEKSFVYRIDPDYIRLTDENNKLLNIKRKDFEITLVKGHNFTHRNIHDGDYVIINKSRIPKVNDIIMCEDSWLWEVKNINGAVYELTRPDERYKRLTLDHIYGVVNYCYTFER